MLWIDGQPQQAFNSADGADRREEFILRKKGQTKEGGTAAKFTARYVFFLSLSLSPEFMAIPTMRVVHSRSHIQHNTLWSKPFALLFSFVCSHFWDVPFHPGEKITGFVEMACNQMFGNGAGWTCGPDPPDENKTFTLKTAKVAVFNRDVWDLLWVSTGWHHSLWILLEAKVTPDRILMWWLTWPSN